MARLEALRLPRRRIRASRGWRRVRWTLLCVATVGVTVL
ncbi:MAG TPA: general secretion pathway protein GspN, partial [Cupriavidus sp.]|nr:general secretion pathway protein GspN [Cupriavidus sp.]